MNANSSEQNIIVIKQICSSLLLSCHLAWMNKRRFCLQKGGIETRRVTLAQQRVAARIAATRCVCVNGPLVAQMSRGVHVLFSDTKIIINDTQ